jgi:hypothetical protein
MTWGAVPETLRGCRDWFGSRDRGNRSDRLVVLTFVLFGDRDHQFDQQHGREFGLDTGNGHGTTPSLGIVRGQGPSSEEKQRECRASAGVAAKAVSLY